MKYLIIVIALCSCQSFNQWKSKGEVKGWLKTDSKVVDSTIILKRDTTRLIAILDTTRKDLIAIIDSSFNSPCDSATKDTLIVRITRYVQGKMKERIINLPVYVNDSLSVKNNNLDLVAYYTDGKLSVKIKYQQCTINTPVLWYQLYWWVWLIAGFLIGSYLFFRLKF